MEGCGKLVLITGGSKGLGFEAARKLAQRGFRIVLTSRSLERAGAAATRIRAEVPEAKVCGLALDLAELAEVRAFAGRFMARERALHVLVANAAAVPEKERRVTGDGYERTFAANHLGHFLLTTTLLPLLEAGAREAGEARVVVVSSRLHLPSSMGPEVRFDFGDVNLTRDYRPMVAYKNSKLANLWFAYELNRRVQGLGITANTLCPGFVPTTIAAEAHGLRRFVFKYVLSLLPFAHSLGDAAKTYLFVTADPSLKGVGGRFYGEKRELRSSPESYDTAKAARLWHLSEVLTAASSCFG